MIKSIELQQLGNKLINSIFFLPKLSVDILWFFSLVMSKLYESFKDHFEIVVADTPELLEKVFRIRYQVLCVEKRLPGFDPALYKDGLEKDSYDRHSSHVLIKFIPSGQFIGTVRFV